MSNAVFPTLKGLGWPVGRKPVFSTTVNKSAGGQETRIPQFPFALDEFDLPINYLHANAATSPSGSADFQLLDGFFRNRLGPWDSFLYLDPTDNYTITNATLAGQSPTYGQNFIPGANGTFPAGDGTTTSFQLFRNLGGAIQPIFDVNGIVATLNPPLPSPFAHVYVAGTLVTTGWSINSTGLLTFVSAPASGDTIAVDFSYFRRVRFRGDDLEFSNFLSNLWKVSKIPLQVVYS